MQTPKHIAIIMDGNGRWASKRGLPRSLGHIEGEKAAERIIERAHSLNIPYLTLYALSIDNLKRDKEEVDGIFNLLISIETAYLEKLQKNNIRLLILGNRDLIPRNTLFSLERVERETRLNRQMTLQIAICYDGQDEILRALKKAENHLDEIQRPSDIAKFFDNPDVPAPDLIIRSGGEKRLSGFMLFHSCYSELAFYDKLWPDWNGEMLDLALDDYSTRERKFGKAANVGNN